MNLASNLEDFYLSPCTHRILVTRGGALTNVLESFRVCILFRIFVLRARPFCYSCFKKRIFFQSYVYRKLAMFFFLWCPSRTMPPGLVSWKICLMPSLHVWSSYAAVDVLTKCHSYFSNSIKSIDAHPIFDPYSGPQVYHALQLPITLLFLLRDLFRYWAVGMTLCFCDAPVELGNF